MIRSMTAFARREVDLPAGNVCWELRSVNHRYLEIGLRLPDELRAMETAVRERVNARLGRGKVDCVCRYKPAVSGDNAFDIDPGNLERLLDACRSVAGRLTETAALNPLELLRWPGVVREQVVDNTPLITGAMALLDTTLDELVSCREREGEQIRQLLLTRCDAMAAQVDHVRPWCRRSAAACASGWSSGWPNWRCRWSRAGSSRNWCCRCRRSMWTRSWIAWKAISVKCAGCWMATSRSAGAWIF